MSIREKPSLLLFHKRYIADLCYMIGAYNCTFNFRNKEIFDIPNNAPSFSCIKLNLRLRFREMYLKSIQQKTFSN